METWPDRVGREIRDTLDSTSTEALRRAAVGETGPLWLLAHSQTSARGRRGRPWAMAPGNFGASLLMRCEGTPAEAALRSFVAALALRDALVEETGRPDLLAMKWPNDVLLSGRKLAGILLETGGVPGGPLVLVVGFGVNLASAPGREALDEGALTAISLQEAVGAAPKPEAFLDRLGPAFARWESRLRAEGFTPVRNAWLAGAARLGEEVTAHVPGREIAGRFETIDASGALILATEQGRLALSAAEVHFPQERAHAARH